MPELTITMNEYSDHEEDRLYLQQFVEKLISDTYQKKLIWNCESREQLLSATCDSDGKSTHPLFAPSKVYPDKVFYRSMFWKEPDHITSIFGNGYYVRIKDGRLYLMRTFTHYITSNDVKTGYELYLLIGDGKYPLCAGYGEEDEFSELMERLYTAVIGLGLSHRITPEARAFIDAYMQESFGSPEIVTEPIGT